MERLVKIAAVLRVHGEDGVPGERLADLAGFTGDSRMDQVKRELRHLASQGWLIDNVAGQGEPAHYRMRTVDNRLRVALTPAQQGALRRAVLLADRGDLVQRLGLPDDQRPADVDAHLSLPDGGEALSQVVRAVRRRALLRFGYKGTARVVHPSSLRTQNGAWYLQGVEDADADGRPKLFVVTRMKDVEVGDPGSARPAPTVRHTGLHPMTWELDPPVEVTLSVPVRYRADLVRWLGEPDEETPRGEDDLLVRYRVTNRAALRARLHELGERVRLLGPPEVRAEVVGELREIAGYGEDGA